MRILFATTAHCANLAKALKRAMARVRVIKLAESQNAVGRMMGYRNWQELASACSPANQVSPWDDEVTADERASRRTHQLQSLVSALQVDNATASSIVDQLRPTGKRKGEKSKAAQDWRTLFEEMVARGGIPGVRNTDDLEDEDDYKVRVDEIGDGDIIQSHPHFLEPGSPFSIRQIQFVRKREGKPIIYAAGVAIRLNHQSVIEFGDLEGYLLNACDQVDDDVMEVASALINRGDADEIFSEGCVLALFAFSRDHAATEKGDGAAFLAKALSAYSKKVAKRRITLAFQPIASQFRVAGLTYNQARALPQYEIARRRIQKWLLNSAPLRNAPGVAGIIAYDRGRDSDSPEASLAVLAKHHGMDDSVKIRAVIDRTIAFQGPPPSTFRSEMGVLTPDQFPAGFNIRVACFFNRLYVHPAIWSHMPSDLARIRIEPTEDVEEFQGGQRPRLNFTFSFANATELTMPSSFMVFGKDAFNMLPELMTASGLLAGYTPPHTEKMFTSDLQQVLGIHTMLLFADHSKVREPIPHAEIVRPGVRPSLVK